MPNRFLKESICTSENIDQLTAFQEAFFYRLIVNCDDFGRFDAREKLLSSRLYPLRDVPVEDVQEALEALQKAGLITIYLVNDHPYLQMKTWEKHQQKRATKSKYPDPVDVEIPAEDNACNQLLSTDNKSPRIRIRNTYNDIRISETEEGAADDEAHAIQRDHDRVLDAAEDAGFKVSNSVRAALIRLYAEHGLEKVLAGISSCVKHGAPTLAYLEACMKDTPKQKKANVCAQDYEQRDYKDVQERVEREQAQRVKKRLNAQAFHQRDYSGVPGQMMKDLADEVTAFQEAEKAGAG